MHAAVEHRGDIASGVLGAVQRDIGTFEQIGRCAAMVWHQRHADAGRYLQALTVQVHRLRQQVAQVVSDGPYLRLHLVARAGQPREQYHELVAAQARHRVIDPHARFQARGNHLQDRVTDGVPQGVVDVFEMVEVEEQQGAAPATLVQQAQLLAEPVHQQRAIGQVGQWVVVRQMAHLRLRLAQGADVAGGQQQAVQPVQPDRLDRDVDGAQPSAFVPTQHFTVVDPALLAERGQQLDALVRVAPDTDVVDATAEHLRCGVTCQSGEAIVDFHEAAGRPLADGDGVGARMERFGELLFAGLERRFGALLLGDVTQGTDTAGVVVDADQPAGHHAGDGAAIPVQSDHRDVAQPALPDHSACDCGMRLPQPDLFGRATDDLFGRPTERLTKRWVDLDELAVVLTGHAHGVWADLEQVGKLVLRRCQAPLTVIQRLGGAFTLPAQATHDAHHPRAARLVVVEATADLQPVQAAVWPTGAVPQHTFERVPCQRSLERMPRPGAVLLDQQVEVITGLGEGVRKTEAKQRLHALGPDQFASDEVPLPGALVRRIQGVEQPLGVVPGRRLPPVVGRKAR